MVFENSYQGLSLRFAVDQFIELTPMLGESFTFKGGCPFTGHSGGVVLNEFKQTIRFEKASVELSGRDLMEKLSQLYRSHGLGMDSRRRINERKTAAENESILCRINAQLKCLEKEIQKISKKINSGGHENRADWLDFEACIQIDYCISETHRLYHPDSDNVLCRQHFDICGGNGEKFVSEFIYSSTDIKSPLKFNFAESYLFHDLYDHQNCYLEDILQISDSYYSFIVKNDFHRKLLLNC